MSYKVKLRIFEGPFDLLVYLIENARMSIYDIRISEITEQYIGYVDEMREADIEGASEFMVLAATLIDIKSRMLLPRNLSKGEHEEDEDPRTELVARILEYKQFKALSSMLAERNEAVSRIYEKPREDISVFLENPEEVLTVSSDKFVSAFRLFLSKKKRKMEVIDHYERVEKEKATMEIRIHEISEKLREALKDGIKRLPFRELVPDKTSKYDTIVSFTSVLQMVNNHMLLADQETSFGEIFVKPDNRM
jgi:segregation and condensation protein A